MLRLIETPEDRRKRYLKFAEEAKSCAGRYPNPETRDAYLKLSQTWAAMAEEIGQVTRQPENSEPFQASAEHSQPA